MAERTFARTDNSVIGVNLHEEPVFPGVSNQVGLDIDDFHEVLLSPINSTGRRGQETLT
jgi:hypothetical protein